MAREGDKWNHQKGQKCESIGQGLNSGPKAPKAERTVNISDVLESVDISVATPEPAGTESPVSQPETAYAASIHEKNCTHSFAKKDCIRVNNVENLGKGRKFEEMPKDGMKTLLRQYNSDKPYACKFCKRRSRRQSSLKAHCKIHTLLKRQTCGIFKKTFKRLIKLQKHLKHLKRHASQEAERREEFSEESLTPRVHAKPLHHVRSSEEWVEDCELSLDGSAFVKRMRSYKPLAWLDEDRQIVLSSFESERVAQGRHNVGLRDELKLQPNKRHKIVIPFESGVCSDKEIVESRVESDLKPSENREVPRQDALRPVKRKQRAGKRRKIVIPLEYQRYALLNRLLRQNVDIMKLARILLV